MTDGIKVIKFSIEKFLKKFGKCLGILCELVLQ